jgi:hypothetical protein
VVVRGAEHTAGGGGEELGGSWGWLAGEGRSGGGGIEFVDGWHGGGGSVVEGGLGD